MRAFIHHFRTALGFAASFQFFSYCFPFCLQSAQPRWGLQPPFLLSFLLPAMFHALLEAVYSLSPHSLGDPFVPPPATNLVWETAHYFRGSVGTHFPPNTLRSVFMLRPIAEKFCFSPSPPLWVFCSIPVLLLACRNLGTFVGDGLGRRNHPGKRQGKQCAPVAWHGGGHCSSNRLTAQATPMGRTQLLLWVEPIGSDGEHPCPTSSTLPPPQHPFLAASTRPHVQEGGGWPLALLPMPCWQLLDAAQVLLLHPYLGPDVLFTPTSCADLPRHSLETGRPEELQIVVWVWGWKLLFLLFLRTQRGWDEFLTLGFCLLLQEGRLPLWQQCRFASDCDLGFFIKASDV